MKKILVVDDDFEQRDLYVSLFSESGFDVVSASDGLEALDRALKEKPDLVFTGIIMPRMDGFELIRNLRNNAVTALTPVIMFSHLGREEDKIKASSLVNTDFMIKGYNKPKEILERVKQLLQGAKPKSLAHDEEDERQPRQFI
ncbi:MAG: response regulator [Candidatus Doudnabacteria bacterium]|nr:response regulator [Candidatus Doudnabacteria bacterium]